MNVSPVVGIVRLPPSSAMTPPPLIDAGVTCVPVPLISSSAPGSTVTPAGSVICPFSSNTPLCTSIGLSITGSVNWLVVSIMVSMEDLSGRKKLNGSEAQLDSEMILPVPEPKAWSLSTTISPRASR